MIRAGQDNGATTAIECPAIVIPIAYEIDLVPARRQGCTIDGEIPRNSDATPERGACSGANNKITQGGRRNVYARCYHARRIRVGNGARRTNRSRTSHRIVAVERCRFQLSQSIQHERTAAGKLDGVGGELHGRIRVHGRSRIDVAVVDRIDVGSKCDSAAACVAQKKRCRAIASTQCPDP